MNPVFNPESLRPFSFGAFSVTRSVRGQQTSVGSVVSSQDVDVTLTTEEGDTVILSLASLTETEAGIDRRTLEQDEWMWRA